MYCSVSNDPANKSDLLGLVEVWFERNAQERLVYPVSGEWSQPDGFGAGSWTETSDTTSGDKSITGYIHVWSGPRAGGICNTTAGTLLTPGYGLHESRTPDIARSVL